MSFDRYSRQVALPQIGEPGQRKLAESHVAVVGCGALGTVSADLLVRAGIGGLTVIDRDVVELSNLQRQTLFDENDANERQPKAVAAAEKLARVNSGVAIRGLAVEFTWDNAVDLIRGHNLVIDATDNHLARLTINDACLEEGIPFIYGGALGFFGMTMNIVPGGPCYRCMVDDLPAPGSGDSCDTAGVLAAVTTVIAANQVAEAIKYLTDAGPLRRELLEVDLLKGAYRALMLPRDSECRACAGGHRDFLSSRYSQAALVVCGRNSVLLKSERSVALDLPSLGSRLASRGYEVKANRFRLQIESGNLEIILFADGRALINGTEREEEARRLYNSLLGS